MSALVVGQNGQDGALLKAKLSAVGQFGLGISRGIMEDSSGRLMPLMRTSRELASLLRLFSINEVYFLASTSLSRDERGQSSLSTSFQDDMCKIGILLELMLDACSQLEYEIKFFFASSSLIFAGAKSFPQTEMTPPAPLEFYAREKVRLTNLIMEFTSIHQRVLPFIGILYNHESPSRRSAFLLPKLLDFANDASKNPALSPIKVSRQPQLLDLSLAKDFVNNMSVLLKFGASGTYVFSSDKPITIEALCDTIFDYFGLEYTNYIDFFENRVEPPTELVGINTKLKSISSEILSNDSYISVEYLIRNWRSA